MITSIVYLMILVASLPTKNLISRSIKVPIDSRWQRSKLATPKITVQPVKKPSKDMPIV